VTAALLVAAHGTRSPEGTATTQAFVAALARARPDVPVSLCFLDVAAPSLRDALDATDARPVVVVPLLLSAGYHVATDIPEVVAGRPAVRVAGHLGPDPAIIAAVADRLAEARSAERGGTLQARSAERGRTAAARSAERGTALAAIASSRAAGHAEVDEAARLLADRLGEPVSVLPLGDDLATRVAALPEQTDAAVYLLAEGGFLTGLRTAMTGLGVVAEPIGVHPAVVSLVWNRYDEALGRVR
jgi:sirohydrochlorin ferrochelatase